MCVLKLESFIIMFMWTAAVTKGSIWVDVNDESRWIHTNGSVYHYYHGEGLILVCSCDNKQIGPKWDTDGLEELGFYNDTEEAKAVVTLLRPLTADDDGKQVRCVDYEDGLSIIKIELSYIIPASNSAYNFRLQRDKRSSLIKVSASTTQVSGQMLQKAKVTCSVKHELGLEDVSSWHRVTSKCLSNMKNSLRHGTIKDNKIHEFVLDNSLNNSIWFCAACYQISIIKSICFISDYVKITVKDKPSDLMLIDLQNSTASDDDITSISEVTPPAIESTTSMMWVLYCGAGIGVVAIAVAFVAGLVCYQRRMKSVVTQREEEVYSYVAVERLPIYEARALAAANKKLGPAAFQPSLPPRSLY